MPIKPCPHGSPFGVCSECLPLKYEEATEGPQTREEWLTNNREICEAEGETEEVIFRNQIETRLAFPIELRNKDDERLGAAYVACLATYEAEFDGDEGDDWAPLTEEHLVEHDHISAEEAKVIVQMAKEEYEGNSTDSTYPIEDFGPEPGDHGFILGS